MSISELVDTGLNTLTDDNGSDHYQHDRDKRAVGGGGSGIKKPGANFRYFLLQAVDSHIYIHQVVGAQKAVHFCLRPVSNVDDEGLGAIVRNGS
jgi:hypothetical protein